MKNVGRYGLESRWTICENADDIRQIYERKYIYFDMFYLISIREPLPLKQMS